MNDVIVRNVSPGWEWTAVIGAESDPAGGFYAGSADEVRKGWARSKPRALENARETVARLDGGSA